MPDEVNTQSIVPATPPSGEFQSLMSQGGLGLGDMDLKPAIMDLVQRTSTAEGAIPGKFRDRLTGEHYDSPIKVILLNVWKTRVLFPPGGDLNSKPLCRSNNGISPAPDSPVPQSHSCKSCAMASWASGRSACKEKLRVLFILAENGLPYIITIGGTSITPFKRFCDGLNRRMISDKAKGEPRNTFDYTVEFRATTVKGMKGTYFALVAANPSPIQYIGEFGQFYERLVLRRNQVDEGEVVEAEVIEANSEVEV